MIRVPRYAERKTSSWERTHSTDFTFLNDRLTLFLCLCLYPSLIIHSFQFAEGKRM